jgi:hypothetical protein
MDAYSPIRRSLPGGLHVAAWAFVVLAYAVGFFLASGTTLGRRLEEMGGGSATGWDKVLHATGFFLFGLLLFQLFVVVNSVWRRSPGLFLPSAVSFLLGSIYAGIHEAGQALFPSLVPEASDVIADVLGLSAAIFLYALWRSTERVVGSPGPGDRRPDWWERP